MTWTGQHIVGTPVTIEPRQEELTVLSNAIAPQREPAFIKEMKPTSPTCVDMASGRTDEEILEKARCNSVTGETFRRLYDDGDIAGFPSQSEADYKLCRMLAFWTNGDEKAMDRLFRQSRLMRDKWDRNVGAGKKYGDLTIEKAVLAQVSAA